MSDDKSKTENETPETTEQPPESAPEQHPADELLVGELLPQEMLSIQKVRGRINQYLMEIGHLEVQKAMKLAALDKLEMEGQQVIAAARERLGIPGEVTLQLSPDGTLRRVPEPQPSNVVPMRPPAGKPVG